MKAKQFGSFYFDPKDVIAIETAPLVPAGSKQGKIDYCHVYIKDISKPVLFTGKAAGEICFSFMGETEIVDGTVVKKEVSLKGDKE